MSDTVNLKKSFWDFKAYGESEWFKKLAKTLFFLAIVYVLLHLLAVRLFPQGAYEYVKLDKGQMQQVNRIYFDSDSSRQPVAAPNKNVSPKDSADSVSRLRAKNLPDSVLSKDTVESKPVYNDSCNCKECTRQERLMCYLWNEFNHKLDTSQMLTISRYLSCASAMEATNFLSDERFQVQSYFWLTGPLVYWEIIFWSWFGVICSLLFNLGAVSKNSTTNPTDPSTYFDSSEIPSQVSKLLYAPACTLVIVLGYNFFNDQNIVDISSSKGVLVFAFIGGFYSSRLISFLDRLKELLLPVSSSAAMVSNAPALKNIVVQVLLDATLHDLSDAFKKDLASIKVTLEQDKNIQRAISLVTDTSQLPLFIFDFVRPGSYSVEALWSTTQNGEVINLKAEQKIEMKDADQSVILTLTRETKE